MNQVGIGPHNVVSTLIAAFDVAGTFVFALSGATAAVKHKLDVFGVLVLCFAAGSAGGVTRDVMIGAIPPAAIIDARYLAVSILAGLVTFFWYPIIDRLSSPVLLFDAAGLGLFCANRSGALHCSSRYGNPLRLALADCAHKATVVITRQRSHWTRRDTTVSKTSPLPLVLREGVL